MKKFIWNSFAIVFASSITLTTIAHAEYQGISTPYQGQHFSVPKGGLSKESVLSHFGEPSQKEKAVGEPPISVWHFQNYSVYFEYDKVIKSVPHKK